MGKATETLTLRSGTMSLGRADDNDIQLTDQTVSAHHARIITYFNASYIEDLNSKNGTYLNGKRVQKHTVHMGDVIALGGMEIKVEASTEVH